MGLLRRQSEHTDTANRFSAMFFPFSLSIHRQILMMLIVSSHKFSLMLRKTTISIIVCGTFLETLITHTHTHIHICLSFFCSFSEPVVLLVYHHQSYILLLLFKIENKQKIINIDKYFLFSLLPAFNIRMYIFPSFSLSHPFFFSSTTNVVTITSVVYVCARI